MMSEVILNARPQDRIKPAVTVENPPPSEHDQHCSAWELPEVHHAVEQMDWTKVIFTTCHFQRGGTGEEVVQAPDVCRILVRPQGAGWDVSVREGRPHPDRWQGEIGRVRALPQLTL